MLKKFFARKNILIIFTVILAFILTWKLINLQLINGEYYREIAERRMYKTTTVKAPRGEIADRYGRPLVSNKAAFSVMINDEFESEKELNQTLLALLEIIEGTENEYSDSLPVSYKTPYEFEFGKQFGSDTTEPEWKAENEFEPSDTAAGIMEKLAEKYEISEDAADDEMIRRLTGLRFDMDDRNFGGRNSFLFISDISIELVSKIKENSSITKGIEIVSEPVRQYPMGGIAAHILGQVGIIYKEEYEELKEKGYGINDVLGKDGLEKYLEAYLKGKDGLESMEFNINGENVVLSQNEPAQPGNRAVLTIDANVQKAAEEGLAEAVLNLYRDGASDVGGAAAVAIEVNTGEVLAIASYPTYNPATFKQDYNKLYNDPKKPMFNRAVGGAYPPGSTFKPLTSIAGLESGVIKGNELIDCNGPYEEYAPSYRPACWIYNDYGGKHGPINVVKALEVSCNIFYYETGRRVGIEKLNEYGRAFGLGEKTGIEISGEEKGILAGPQYREEVDGIWYPGDTIAAAIGQSDNSFTPIQMANYAATIANGGKRYAPHLVKEIINYDGSKTIASFTPKLLNEVEISEENLALVHQGMRQVCTDGSAKVTFADAPFEAAGKTGTAQTRRDRTPHSWFISFAPYDNPQVAIAVVAEHGGVNGLGKNVYNVARKMFEAYFYSSQQEKQINDYTLIQ